MSVTLLSCSVSHVQLLISCVQLQCDVLDSSGQLSSIQEDVRFAACDLVCEWAQKVLKRQFDDVEDLARFLIDSHYISNKSLAALTITTGTATGKRQFISASCLLSKKTG